MRPLKRSDSSFRAGDGGGPRLKARLGVVAQLVFWSWNGLLATIAVFGLSPVLGVAFVRDSIQGTLPSSLLVALFCLVLLPLASIGAGLRLRKDPTRLLALFYGLEVPLLIVGIVRLFLVQELTAQLAVAGTLTLLGLAGFAASMVVRRRSAMLFACVAVLGLAALAFATLGALYAVPIFVSVLRELPGAEVRHHPEILVYVVLGVAFVLYTATLVIASPLIASYVYAVTVRRLAHGVGTAKLAGATALGAAIAVTAIQRTSVQPHIDAFALLGHPPASDAERLALLRAGPVIRAGLLDAYLAGQRYVSATGDSSTLAELYATRFGGTAADYDWLRRFNDFMVAPFLFDAEQPHRTIEDAGGKYAQFFDATIEENEHARISEALEASFQRDTVGATLLDRNAERVRLREQDVTVTPHDDWAEIEVHEAYVNVTDAMQEVLYHFELPESAVVTGLWLGETADKSAAHVFQVAPRGAAQRVYREAQARALDPALLEQVGPRQYRLRVFPILPETAGEPAQPTHLWLRVAVMRDHGHYPLPRIAERRNVFFAQTARTMNGAVAAWSEWLPPAVDAPATPSHERVVNIDGFGVRMAPLAAPAAPLTGRHITVVVDRSRSMTDHRRELEQALGTVRSVLAARNAVDVVLASAVNRGEPVVHTSLAGVGDIVFYGGQALSEMLRATVGHADLTLVLTDDDGVKHESEAAPLRPDGSVWLVHLGGSFPAAYADAVTDVVASPRSGIAASVQEAVARFSAAERGMLVDGERVWSLVPAAQRAAKPRSTSPSGQSEATSVATDGFDALAARALVRLAGFGMLDRDAHRIAVDHAIVTPLSSMIVLVTDAQRQALNHASAGGEAFARQTETGGLPHAPSFVTGVPEPEEWLLLAFAALSLVVAACRAKRGQLTERSTCQRTMMSSGST